MNTTRDKLLLTAFQLFHEQGFHATGISTILRESGLNPGSMYHVFPSKDAVLIGVLEFALQLLRPAVIDPVEAATQDPIGRVFELLAQYRRGMVLSGCRMGCPMGNLALEVSDDKPDARKLIDANFRNWAAQVEGWLVAAGDRLPADLDRGRLARFILTVMEGGLMQARAAGSLGPFDDSVGVLRDYFDVLEERARSLSRSPVSAPEPSPAPARVSRRSKAARKSRASRGRRS